ENFRLLQFDWRQPPADLRVPVVLAADVTYESRNLRPLVSLVKRVLLPDGVCLLTDPDRAPAQKLSEMLTTAGLAFTTQMVRAGGGGLQDDGGGAGRRGGRARKGRVVPHPPPPLFS